MIFAISTCNACASPIESEDSLPSDYTKSDDYYSDYERGLTRDIKGNTIKMLSYVDVSTGLEYTVIDSTHVSVGSGTNTSSTLTISSTWTYESVVYTVSEVTSNGWHNNTTLTSLSLPSSISKIGTQAFLGASALITINVPSLVNEIYPSTFSGCGSLFTITFDGDAITSVDDFAFALCTSIKTINLPSSVTIIKECAFQSCIKLIRMLFPTSCTTVRKYAFIYCTGLALVHIPSALTLIETKAFLGDTVAKAYLSATTVPATFQTQWNYSLASVTLATSDIYVDDNGDFIFITKSGTATILEYIGSGASVVIPANFSINGTNYPVTVLATSSFSNKDQVTSISFGSNLITIDANACFNLYNCTNYDFTNATSLTTIGNYAFTSDSAPSSLTTSLWLPANIVTIGNGAFRYFRFLTSLTFEDTALKPSQLTSIGTDAFRDITGSNGVMDLVLPKSLVTINSSAFNNSDVIRSITFTENANTAVKLTVGNTAFGYLDYLVSINWSPNIYRLNQYAFRQDVRLETVYLPSYIDIMDADVFYGCTYVCLYAQPSTRPNTAGTFIWDANFNRTSNLITDSDYAAKYGPYTVPVYYGVSSASAIYTNTTYGFNYIIESSEVTITHFLPVSYPSITAITIPSTLGGYNVTKVGNSSFYSCTQVRTVIFPTTVTYIGNYAFARCTNITSFSIPSYTYRLPTSLTTIGFLCFYYCTALLQLHMNYLVTSIGDHFIENCNKVSILKMINYSTGVETPSSAYKTANNVLYNAAGTELIATASITSVLAIPSGVVTVDQHAARGMAKWTAVTIPDSVVSILDGAFYQSTAITNVTFNSIANSSCILIDQNAFYGDSNIVSIDIPSGLQTIGANAFYGNSKLKQINDNDQNLLTFPTSLTTLGLYAFRGAVLLTKVIMPSSLTTVAADVFYGNTNTSCYVEDTYQVYLDTKIGSSWAANWNRLSTSGTTCATFFYAETTSDVYSLDSTIKYWHYVGGVPTEWTPS